MEIKHRSKRCMSIKKEFRWKNLWFEEKNPTKFATTAWLQSQLPFLVYRIVCFIYAGSILGWSCYKASQLPTEHDVVTWFLSYPVWSFMLFSFYNTLALLLTALNFDYDCLCNDDLSWYHKVCWILHVVVFNGATSTLLGTIVYHIAKAGQDSTATACLEIFNSDDINFYAICAIVMVTDVFIHSIPIRFLHFVYPAVFFTLYVLIQVYRFAAGFRSTHTIFSFRTLPVPSTVVFLLLVVILYIPAVHLLAYAIDSIRRRLILKLRSRNRHEILRAVNSSYFPHSSERTTLQTTNSARYQTSALRNGSENLDHRKAKVRESRHQPMVEER